ncbi:MAG: dTMP kinase, partial [Candidatus Micrarchaeota archaeon]
MNGLLIAFEGIDGAGKRTQVELLRQYLEEKGKKCTVYSYPDYSGSVFGKVLGEFLEKKSELDVRAQFLMYAGDMLKDQETMKRALENGEAVICDRYISSTAAYQSANGFKLERATSIQRELELITPNLTFFLDVSVETSLARKSAQKKEKNQKLDRFEENKQFLEKVRA